MNTTIWITPVASLPRIWHWSAGEATTGTLGYRYRRSLRDFANQTSLDKTEDIRTEHQLLASGDLDLPGAWKIGVRGDVADISFSNTETLDLQRTTLGASVGYVSGAGSVIGFDAEFVNGDYDSNPFSNFDEYTVGPTLEWQFTARTQLEAKIGYTSRDYDVTGADRLRRRHGTRHGEHGRQRT